MPPRRPPLSSSSSFAQLPLSDYDASIQQGSQYARKEYTQGPLEREGGYQEQCSVPHYTAERYTSTTSPEKDRMNASPSKSCPDYGGAGYYSQPHHKRLLRLISLGIHSAIGHDTMKSQEKQQKAALLPTINKDNNMTRRIATWLTASYIFRQFVYITSIGLLLWVPGLTALLGYEASPQNSFNRPTILSVGLFWWSVWLSSAWVAIWACSLIANTAPFLLRRYSGVLAIAFKDVIVYAEATKRYIAFLIWSIIIWVIYLATVWSQFPSRKAIQGTTDNHPSGPSTNSTTTETSPLSSLLSLVPALTTQYDNAGNDVTLTSLQSNEAHLVSLSRFLAGIMICSAILLVEKVAMQWIAVSFNQTTYSDRIEKSMYHISVLTTMYAHASTITPLVAPASIPLDVRDGGDGSESDKGNVSTVFARAQKFKKTLTLGQSSTIPSSRQPFGLISSSVLNSSQFPFSFQAVVEASLESSTNSRRLAKQIFLAFAKSKDAKTGETVLTEEDLYPPLFKTIQESNLAFMILNNDNNDSCTWEEVQASVLGMHKERLCLLASLHDIDCAVLKLDSFFMTLYCFISCVIIAALLSTKFSTLVASLGTILLGLSWLVGTTAQESLSSIVWVFGKHPVDVGDTIEVPGLVSSTITSDMDNTFIVEEIQLLSTILKTRGGKQVSISNAQLAQKAILNLRRSGPTQENITIVVDYCTPLESIEKLRSEMIKWIDTQSRDFLPGLNVELNALDDQSKLSLTMDIRYKSNWQDEHLKAMRKNRWMTALKQNLAQLRIFGPSGNPNGVDSMADSKAADVAIDGLIRVHSFSLMDQRNAFKVSDRRMSGEDADLQTSRLNPAMPTSATSHQHTNPTTQVTSVNVPGLRRHDEQRTGDLERGTPYCD